MENRKVGDKMLFSDKTLSEAEYNPLAVAYIGDTVYDLFIRTKILEKGNKQVTNMHKEAVKFVNASAQAKCVTMIEPFLTEKEVHLIKWGKNAKSVSVPKNANVKDYHTATGFEVLIGSLYISNQTQRLNEILNIAYEKMLNIL